MTKRKTAFQDGDYLDCKDSLPSGLIGYIRRTVLPEDNVLLYRKGGKRGYCFLCGNYVKPDEGKRFVQHLSLICPSCGQLVCTALEGGESYYSNCIGDIGAFQKSKDGKTVFIRFFHILRTNPFTLSGRKANQFSRTQLKEFQRFAFKQGATAKWLCEVNNRWSPMQTGWSYRAWTDWFRNKRLSVVYGAWSYYLSVPKDWKRFTKGTSLAYCDLPKYLEEGGLSPVRYCDYYSRLPAFEKLEKAGYKGIVNAKLNGNNNVRSVAWSKHEISKALRMPKRVLKTKHPEDWRPEVLDRYIKAFSLQEKKLCSEAEAIELAEREGIIISYIEEVLMYTSVHKLLKYLKTQIRPVRGASEYYYKNLHLEITYGDYIADCIRLNYDMHSEQVLYPKNLQRAHKKTIELVKYKENEALIKAFAARADSLEKYSFVKGGLLIRPAHSEAELIKEGQCNHHCVGGYAKDMAEGKTAIFFIRRADEPEKTFYTLEFKQGHVVQCRTKYNRGYDTDKEIKRFVEAWLAHINKRGGKRKAAGVA